MTQHQENIEHLLISFYENRYVSDYTIQSIIDNTYKMIESGELKRIHELDELVKNTAQREPTLINVLLFTMSYEELKPEK